jgi:hypothetical protein
MDAILTDFYAEHFARLVSAGESLHHLTRKEAESIAHDILVASLNRRTPPENPTEFFAGALKHAVMRRNGRG